jgi:hypothetical protein
MALSRISGYRVAVTGVTTVYTGAGRLLGLLISHNQASIQILLIQDNATTIAQIYCPAGMSPIYISFGAGEPPGGKQEGIPFTTSLVVTRGNVEVNLWYLGY